MKKDKKSKKKDSKIYTNFYDFNKWLHEKDWISANVIPYKHNEATRPMIWSYEVVIPTIL